MWTYSPAEFDNLHEFRDAKAVLIQNDNKIVKVGNIICQHGFEEFIGLNLLHKHFDLQSDERLVRRYLCNSAEMRPSNRTTDIVPYSWKLNRVGHAYSLIPLEFVERGVVGDTVEAMVEILTRSQEFVFDIGSKLDELDLLDGFGLVILNSDVIHLKDGEILLETTDHSSRCSTLQPWPSALAGTDITGTTWSFRMSHGENKCAGSSTVIGERKRKRLQARKSDRLAGTRIGPLEQWEFAAPALLETCISHCGVHCKDEKCQKTKILAGSES